MKSRTSHVIAWITLASFVFVIPAAAQVPPSSVRLQGYLTDRTVNPAVPANGTFTMTFELWDHPSGGSPIQQHTLPGVTVTDGLYDVSLPFGPADFDGPRWLEITIDGEVLMPRLAIESSPYAYLAGHAQQAATVDEDGVDTAAIQDEAVTLDKLALDCSPGDFIGRTASGWECVTYSGCFPGATQACYTGPPGTEGVGECEEGIETCQPDGTWGACDGEVTPTPEVCNTKDDDCNGLIDDNAVDAPTWYPDADQDTFGNPAGPVQSCNQPPGTATNGLDCYDENADARPTQTAFFDSHRGDGSFDYDCNTSQERQWLTEYECNIACQHTDGWENFVPNCGQTHDWGTGCDIDFVSCEPDTLQPRTQACR